MTKLLLTITMALPCMAQATPIGPAAIPVLVAKHCGKCHTGPDAEQGFEIAPLFSVSLDATAKARVATALQRVRSRTMPPLDAAIVPSDLDRLALAAALSHLVPAPPDARIATLRRLSRAEYEHTIHDLTGITWDAKELLPEDARSYGFDNVGDVMRITPMLFEKYFDAAADITAHMLSTKASRTRVFDDSRPLTESLAAFMERAFRRPVTTDEVAERVLLHDDLLQSGLTAALAQQALLRSILASPSFLFRAELGTSKNPAQLTPHELAVRLSYFLSSSMPDDALLACARDGTILAPAVLHRETRRLIANNGGRALADNFAAQWLRFREVLTATADFRRYPQIWNANLRVAFYEETAQLFAEIARDDGSVLWLLDCDHTFANETLAKHYGLPPVQGNDFVRVPLPDRRRGGLLGMSSVLMVSSHALRTSPVLRGRWILDQLLDAATPPPPANAGVLPADDQQPDNLSLRERLELHRRDRACAACHAQIDPLGFALENYDVLGGWRTEIHGKPVDARATLPDGTELDGPIALKDALLARKVDFARAMVTKLLVYSIGRPMVSDDEPEIARIVVATEKGDYRFLALLDALVESPLFLLRDPGGSR